MKFIDNMSEKIRNNLLTWIMEGYKVKQKLELKTDLTVEQLENDIWYKGNSCELEDLYNRGYNKTKSGYFWSHVYEDQMIRKIHSGIPAMIVDKLAQITPIEEITIDMDEEILDLILEENKIGELNKEAITQTLSIGDGAYKLNIDSELSEYPIIEFVKGNNVDYMIKRGRLQAVVFNTYIKKEKKEYVIKEIYGKGYIDYKLFEIKNGELTELPLNYIPEGEELPQIVEGTGHNVIFDSETIFATPAMIYKHPEFTDRGKSIFYNKIDIFDSIDENLSIWSDALRDGRVEKYIPENKIPRDPETGVVRRPDGFNTRYITTERDMSENGNNKIETVQPDIKYQTFEATYDSQVKNAMLGIISPSSLGMDFANKDNADAQREREKTTLHTRNDIIESFEQITLDLLYKVMELYNLTKGQKNKEYEITVKYGTYATPTFEQRATTLAEAKFKGIISNEKVVRELWGDELTEEEQNAEIALLNNSERPMMEINNIVEDE